MSMSRMFVWIPLFLTVWSSPAASVALADGTRHHCGTLAMRSILGPAPAQVPIPASASRSYPVLGESRSFWTYDLSVMPPKNKAIPATCRAVGENVVVWVGDAEWGTTVEQADVDSVLSYMESTTLRNESQGVYAANTALFGNPPAAQDGDPGLTILVYDIPGYNGYLFDGYFRAEDLSAFNASCETNPMLYCSNELAMVHVNSTNVGSAYMAGVIAHEFEHLIHYGQDSSEEIWLDESLAELAMIYSGFEDDGNLAYFAAHPEDNLMVDAPVDYGACLLFGSYLWEHLGDSGIRELVSDAANGRDAVQTAIESDFPAFFALWSLANLADTQTSLGATLHSLVDVPEMRTLEWADPFAAQEVSVPASASHYAHIAPSVAEGQALFVQFTSANGARLLVWDGADYAEEIPSDGSETELAAGVGDGSLYLSFSNPMDTDATGSFVARVDGSTQEILPEENPETEDIVSQEDATTTDVVAQDAPQAETVADNTEDSSLIGEDTGTSSGGSSGGCSTSMGGTPTVLWLLGLALSLLVVASRHRSAPRSIS